MKNIVIYTDGACSGNPGIGGWGAIITQGKIEKEICGGEENTTNNRMELMAAICSLERLKEKCHVDLFTDSKYVQQGITQWIHGWLKNNWKTADKKPIKNQDLWMRLLTASQKHEVSWNWVKGHSGNLMNERVDTLARFYCEKSKVKS